MRKRRTVTTSENIHLPESAEDAASVTVEKLRVDPEDPVWTIRIDLHLGVGWKDITIFGNEAQIDAIARGLSSPTYEYPKRG